jgi:hypothetical protein
MSIEVDYSPKEEERLEDKAFNKGYGEGFARITAFRPAIVLTNQPTNKGELVLHFERGNLVDAQGSAPELNDAFSGLSRYGADRSKND